MVEYGCLCGQLLDNRWLDENIWLLAEVLLLVIGHLVLWERKSMLLMLLDITENVSLLNWCQLATCVECVDRSEWGYKSL